MAEKLGTFIKKHGELFLLATFLVTVVPILVISIYDHPCGDDLGYGKGVHAALLSGNSVFAVIIAACQTVYKTYLSWQGTYSAIFL